MLTIQYYDSPVLRSATFEELVASPHKYIDDYNRVHLYVERNQHIGVQGGVALGVLNQSVRAGYEVGSTKYWMRPASESRQHLLLPAEMFFSPETEIIMEEIGHRSNLSSEVVRMAGICLDHNIKAALVGSTGTCIATHLLGNPIRNQPGTLR